MKKCPRCQTVKPFVDFHKNASSKTGFNTYCKPCKAIQREFKYARVGHLERERKRAWYYSNPDLVLKQQRKKWLIAKIRHIIRYEKLPKMTTVQMQPLELILRSKQVSTCKYCSAPMTYEPNGNAWLDHILPRSKYPSGALDPDNLQWLCKECNWLKANRTEAELLLYLRHLRDIVLPSLEALHHETIIFGAIN